MNYPFIASPNFTLGRKKKIKALVIHRTQANLIRTLERCFNPGFPESFHYLVSQKGKIIQTVRCKDTAWHAGWITNPKAPDYLKPNPNFTTIGIACEDLGLSNENYWTTQQKEALLKLIKFLKKTLALKIDQEHVLSHSFIDPKRNPQDPGIYTDWEMIFREAATQEKRENDPLKKYRGENRFVLESIIEKLFFGIMKRRPDPSEIDYFRNSGLDVAQISRRLINSEEFRKAMTKQ